MTISAGLSLALWLLLVFGAAVYLMLRLYEWRAGLLTRTASTRHTVLSRVAFFLLALDGIGVISFLLGGESVGFVQVIVIVIRAAAIGAVWTLVLFDAQRVRESHG